MCAIENQAVYVDSNKLKMISDEKEVERPRLKFNDKKNIENEFERLRRLRLSDRTGGKFFIWRDISRLRIKMKMKFVDLEELGIYI